MANTAASGQTSLRSWLIITGAATSMFCTVGFMNSFGVFEEVYASPVEKGGLNVANGNMSTIGWVGAIAVLFLFGSSPASGILMDLFGPKVLTCAGALGQIFSLMMVSICKKFWHFLLAQGALLGICMSLVTWPMLALVAKNINANNRAAAMGLVLAGSSLGGIIWPIAINEMLKKPNLGFPWTMRIVAFMMIPLFALPCAVASSQTPSSTPPRPVATSDSETEVSGREDSKDGPKLSNQDDLELSDRQAYKEPEARPDPASIALPNKELDIKAEAKALFRKPEMICLCVGLFLTYFGFFSPFFYVTNYAIEEKFSSTLAFYTISIVNGASFFGRVIPGVLADKYGRFNLIIIATVLSGVIAMTWSKITSVAGLVMWCLAYGFASGGILSLQQACATQIATPATAGLAIGSVVGATALSGMANIPISGALASKHGYLSLSLFCGASLLLGSVFLILARLSQSTRLMVAI